MSDFSRRDPDPVGDDDPDAPGDELSDDPSDDLSEDLADDLVPMTDPWTVAPALEDPWADAAGAGLGALDGGGLGPPDGDDLDGGWASDASI